MNVYFLGALIDGRGLVCCHQRSGGVSSNKFSGAAALNFGFDCELCVVG